MIYKKHIHFPINQILLLFLLLIFTGTLASCSLRANHEPTKAILDSKEPIDEPKVPIDETADVTWVYPGGAGPHMSMVFHANGSLSFLGGFNNYHPATWHVDKKTHKLRITLSNYDKFPTECETSSTKEYSCLLYNPQADSFECKFTQDTKIITFLGWNFFRNSE
jgi:hypothetical protein